MATLNEALGNAQNLKNLEKEVFSFLRSIEVEIFSANINQLVDSRDSKNVILKHSNSKKYSGLYTQMAEDEAKLSSPLMPKEAGDPYNFIWTGDFVRGFKMDIHSGYVSIFSTGAGGSKSDFFDGYDNLFGLTDKNLESVIKVKLLPFLQKSNRTTLKI